MSKDEALVEHVLDIGEVLYSELSDTDKIAMLKRVYEGKEMSGASRAARADDGPAWATQAEEDKTNDNRLH